MNTGKALLAVVVLLHLQAAAEAQTVFKSFLELEFDAAADTVVLNAQIADPGDWPASFFSTHEGGNCTSTLIGPQTLITAAHCVPDGGSAQITLQKTSSSARCSHAPEYKSNGTMDLALCHFETPVTHPRIRYERISTDPKIVSVGQRVLLTGFGCATATGRSDGRFRTGEVPIVRLPAGPSFDIVTKGEAALCFGDSGGGAYVLVNGSPATRFQISVNSRGNIRDESYLTSLAAEPSRRFLSDWSTKHRTTICGLHSDATGCK